MHICFIYIFALLFMHSMPTLLLPTLSSFFAFFSYTISTYSYYYVKFIYIYIVLSLYVFRYIIQYIGIT